MIAPWPRLNGSCWDRVMTDLNEEAMTDQERAFESFEAAADTIATTPLPAGMSGSRDHLIAAAKAYVNVRERMTGPIGVDGDGNVLVVTVEEARRMKQKGPRIIERE